MMALAGSVQLPRESTIRCNYRHTNRNTGLIGKGRLKLVSINLSSQALRQDAWSLMLCKSVRNPIGHIRARYTVFLCQSSLTSGAENFIPALKSAVYLLTRSYNALYGSALIRKLIPAIAITTFAAWGVGPLMRLTRNFFLQKNDSSWKKSSVHYVLTSYIRPLLLWTGAILICRALDPVVLPTDASQAVKQRLLIFVRSLSTVLAFAYCLSSLIQQAQKFLMELNDSTDTGNMGFQFAGKAIYSAVWVAAVSLFMELLGFSTQKWMTAGGLGTVLLTLAGREIFTNFLSSVMIHATRPFVVNEWIQTKIEGYEVSGTVEHVGWWSPTIIRGDDREAVHIPNHKFTVSVVRNLSQKTHWRIKTHLCISHLDANKINNIVADMRKVLAKNPQVEQQRLHRRVFLEDINPENQALMILISCFVKTPRIEEYLCVKEAILQDLLRVISHHRARLATPIRTVQKIYGETDIDSIPFADTIFNSSREAANRSVLLIEPSYKINGDEKNKGPARPVVRKNEEKDVDAASTLESKADANKTGSMPYVDTKIDDKNVATANTVKKSDISTFDTSVHTQQELNPKDEIMPTSVGTTKVGPMLEKPVSSVLEDNIVLGVALDGSKRMLPIEDENVPSPTESKEMAA